MASPVDGPPLANLHRPPINPGEFRNKCRYCPSTFAKSEHLARHQRTHTKERPYVCPICGKRFTRGDSLTRHVRLHENGTAAGQGEEDEDESEPRLKKKKVADAGYGKGKGRDSGQSPERSGQREGSRQVSREDSWRTQADKRRRQSPMNPQDTVSLDRPTMDSCWIPPFPTS